MKPWWAISSVSISTLGESVLKLGPVHRTGTMSMIVHFATVVPSARFASITPVLRW